MRPAPTVDQAIGTIAHNRPFAPRELREYLGDDNKALRAWFKAGLLERVGRGLYSPTRLGWWRIERGVWRGVRRDGVRWRIYAAVSGER